jgi:hypothetical protein
MTARPQRDQLRLAVEARRAELRITMIQMDADCSLASNYYSKAICGVRSLSGTTLDKVLAALGVRIALVPDERLLLIRARARSDMKKRCAQVRWAKTPKAERSEPARKAVHARWAKARRLKAVRGAATRQKNQVSRAILEWMIWNGSIEQHGARHGFFRPSMAGLAGSFLKWKGRRRRNLVR